MKESTIAERKFITLLILIATQVLCAGCNGSQNEDKYVKIQVTDNKDGLAKEMFRSMNLGKHSERLDLKPLELTDFVPTDNDENEEESFMRHATKNKDGLAKEMLGKMDLGRNSERLGLEPLKMTDFVLTDGRSRVKKIRAMQPAHDQQHETVSDYEDQLLMMPGSTVDEQQENPRRRRRKLRSVA